MIKYFDILFNIGVLLELNLIKNSSQLNEEVSEFISLSIFFFKFTYCLLPSWSIFKEVIISNSRPIVLAPLTFGSVSHSKLYH